MPEAADGVWAHAIQPDAMAGAERGWAGPVRGILAEAGGEELRGVVSDTDVVVMPDFTDTRKCPMTRRHYAIVIRRVTNNLA